MLLPALTALLLPLTGLAAGACQEAFYSWSENYPAGFGECVMAACKRGLHVVASQAVSLIGPLLVLTCCLAPGMSGGIRFLIVVQLGLIVILISLFGLTRQPSFAAGNPRFGRAFRYAMRASGQHFGTALLLAMMRGLLWVFAVLNLHLLAGFALWAIENLGGFDVAYLSLLMSLDNSAYFLALVLLARCLLSPFNEAANYLFFLDVRTRTEGLDLWNRVEDQFPASQRVKAGIIMLAVLGAGWLSARPVAAQELLADVRTARQEIVVIRGEVKAAKPYPGGSLWMPRLEKTCKRLELHSPIDSFRWLRADLEGFAKRDQDQAVSILEDIDARLAMLEDSLAQPRRADNDDEPSTDRIKGLVPPARATDKRKSQKVDDAKDKKKERRQPEEKDEAPVNEIPRPGGPRVVGPVTGLGGIATVLLYILVGLGVAVLVASIAFVLAKLWQSRGKALPRQAGNLAARADDYLEDPDKQDPSQLWRQADEKARAGDFLGAVRTLYLAVLALLHQGGFIRYERTRTNGEYVDQLRRRTGLQRPFLGLTGLFEVKWYGERACEPDDYRRCRELAEEVRTGSLRPEQAPSVH